MADIAYEVQGGVYKIENSAIKRAFEIAGITVTSVLNGDSATMTLNEDIDGDGVAENQQEFTLTGGTETFDLAGYEVKQDNEIWLSFDFVDDGNIADAGRIEDVTFEPSDFILGLTEIQNYLEDDWNDNRLTDRQWRDSDINQGVFAHPDANEAGDTLIGRYRPEWNIQIESQPIDRSNQDIRVDLGGGLNPEINAQITTPSNFSSGTMYCDFQYLTIGTSADGLELKIFSNDSSSSTSRVGVTGYSMVIGDSADSAYRFEHHTGSNSTTLIGSTWSADTAYHSSIVNRDSYGNFETFFDGVSHGTATDTSIVEFTHSHISWYNSAGGSHILVDNLVIN